MCRVPTPPEFFFKKIPRPGKLWKITLVLESPGKTWCTHHGNLLEFY